MSSFTQKALLQTFEDMLETMPFDKITVSAIIKACGLSKNTFYYHYQDIYELLDAWMHEKFEKYATSDSDWQGNVTAILYACKEHPKVVYNVFHSLSRDNMERYVFTMTYDSFFRYVKVAAAGYEVSEDRIADIADFCRYSFFGFFLKFLWSRMDDDIDESVAKLSNLFSGFVHHAVEQSVRPRGNN
jgi:AcrR family transcriptional regulator